VSTHNTLERALPLQGELPTWAPEARSTLINGCNSQGICTLLAGGAHAAAFTRARAFVKCRARSIHFFLRLISVCDPDAPRLRADAGLSACVLASAISK
jgi:hypothetical protein